MITYIIWAIVFYLLFRFIFNFVVPLVRAGRQMRRQMHEFQNRMNQQFEDQGKHDGHSYHADGAHKTSERKEQPQKAGDYIDFEEIK